MGKVLISSFMLNTALRAPLDNRFVMLSNYIICIFISYSWCMNLTSHVCQATHGCYSTVRSPARRGPDARCGGDHRARSKRTEADLVGAAAAMEGDEGGEGAQ